MALTMKDLEAQIQELRTMVQVQGDTIEALRAQVESQPKGRDRGPASEGEMTEEHAVRVMLGDLREASHKEAAIELKLSYGQIYSARKGYTFKKVYQRMIKGEVIDTPEVEEMSITEEVAAEKAAKIQPEGEA